MNPIPRQVKTAAGALKADDKFVEAVHDTLELYRDMRWFETHQTPQREIRDDAADVLAKLAAFRQALRDSPGNTISREVTNDLDRALAVVRRHYAAREKEFQPGSGQGKKKQGALRWLVPELDKLFQAHGVALPPKFSMAAFLAHLLPLYSPENTTPSRRTIELAVAESRK